MQLQAKVLATGPRAEYHDPTVLQRCSYPISSGRVGHSVDFIFSEPVRSSIARWNILAPPPHLRAVDVEHQEATPPLTGPDDQVAAMRRPAHA